MELIGKTEKDIVQYGLAESLRLGAEAARITLNKTISDTCVMRDGVMDSIQHRLDRSLTVTLFADNRSASFSTNRLEADHLSRFLSGAVKTMELLEKDPCRQLPPAGLMVKDAINGYESGLWDEGYSVIDANSRLASVAAMHIEGNSGDGWKGISEENEYTDYCDATLVADSRGFSGIQYETGFSCSSEQTVITESGERYSSYWWESSAFRDRIVPRRCSETALKRAVSSIFPETVKSGRKTMVVDGNIASRLLSPVTSALVSTSIQQNMSFLCGSKGRKLFSSGLNLTDEPRAVGCAGARWFDSEGVATKNRTIIENGIVRNYFTNTWSSLKTGEERTCEDISRPVLRQYIGEDLLKEGGKTLLSGGKRLSLEDILALCQDGLYVTGFNGGNCNSVTGDFSFGVEGFEFHGGQTGRPFREMLITGNIKDLWNSLLAIGGDARDAGAWRLPTIAFAGVSFSA